MSHTAEQRPGAEIEAWVRSAFGLLAGLPGVRRVGLALVEGGGRRLSFIASDRGDLSGAVWCDVDAYEDVPLNNTVRTGTVITGSLDQLAGRYPEFVDRQASSTQAVASAPLSVAGQIIGGFTLFYESRQPFDEPQVDELRRVGEWLGAELRRGQPSRTLSSSSEEPETLPPGALVASHLVAPDPRGVGPARHFVRRTLAAWGIDGDAIEAAVLCVSELVTNAIIHTVAGCEVRLVLHHEVLTTSVRDGGTFDRRPGSPEADPLAVHGRGLRLVDALSARWGSDHDAVGMTVWCELAVS
ncbi:MAG TPA: ATP-binding protein [Nocardioides sp.]|uniref:ATP-binding protein n=1 Tax=Nocardioides sp. TaxID=35761 RepID=UPI002F426613